jgi:hypothetical protein
MYLSLVVLLFFAASFVAPALSAPHGDIQVDARDNAGTHTSGTVWSRNNLETARDDDDTDDEVYRQGY